MNAEILTITLIFFSKFLRESCCRIIIDPWAGLLAGCLASLTPLYQGGEGSPASSELGYPCVRTTQPGSRDRGEQGNYAFKLTIILRWRGNGRNDQTISDY